MGKYNSYAFWPSPKSALKVIEVQLAVRWLLDFINLSTVAMQMVKVEDRSIPVYRKQVTGYVNGKPRTLHVLGTSQAPAFCVVQKKDFREWGVLGPKTENLSSVLVPIRKDLSSDQIFALKALGQTDNPFLGILVATGNAVENRFDKTKSSEIVSAKAFANRSRRIHTSIFGEDEPPFVDLPYVEKRQTVFERCLEEARVARTQFNQVFKFVKDADYSVNYGFDTAIINRGLRALEQIKTYVQGLMIPDLGELASNVSINKIQGEINKILQVRQATVNSIAGKNLCSSYLSSIAWEILRYDAHAYYVEILSGAIVLKHWLSNGFTSTEVKTILERCVLHTLQGHKVLPSEEISAALKIYAKYLKSYQKIWSAQDLAGDTRHHETRENELFQLFRDHEDYNNLGAGLDGLLFKVNHSDGRRATFTEISLSTGKTTRVTRYVDPLQEAKKRLYDAEVYMERVAAKQLEASYILLEAMRIVSKAINGEKWDTRTANAIKNKLPKKGNPAPTKVGKPRFVSKDEFFGASPASEDNPASAIIFKHLAKLEMKAKK